MGEERLSNLLTERELMKKYLPWICLVLALAGGIFGWWVDSRNDEPQAAVLVILMVTFVLGFLVPRRAWLWAIITGLCLPLGYLLTRTVGYLPAAPVEPGWYASALALIPAFIGAYLGAFARVIFNSAFTKS
jgi:glycopeptide antibiotics resistance protein